MKIRILLTELLILVSLFSFPMALAATQSYSIQVPADDIFMTESGAVFRNSELIVLQDTGYSVIIVLRFQNIAIARNSLINQANLTVTTATNFPDDPNASATIYGVNIYELDPLEEPYIFPQTSSSIVWNISEVRGFNTEHVIDITPIIQEIISKANWQSGNALGLRINSVAGEALRHFYSRDYSQARAASLSIRFNENEPGPWVGAGEAYWNRTVYPYDVWLWDQTVYENFTKYTLGADVQGRITNKDDWNITWATLSRSDNDAEAHYQYAAGTFQTFSHWFTFQSTNVLNFSFRQHNAIAYHNNVYDSELHYVNNNLDLIAVGYRTFNGKPRYYHLDLVEVTGMARNIQAGTVQYFSNDILYCTLNKSGTAFNLYIYRNDRTRQTLTETISLTLSADWNFRRSEIPQCLELAPSSPNNGYFDRFAIGAKNMSWAITRNGTLQTTCPLDDPECVEAWLENNAPPDPGDPDPGSQGWPLTGPFTRFRTRLYILIVGMTFLLAPPMGMAWQRPDIVYVVSGLIVMLMGLGLLIAVTQI